MVDVRTLLGALHALGARSLMVEGGARVIRSFLEAAGAPRAENQNLGHGSSAQTGGEKVIDALVVTVAPKMVGEAGVGYGSGLLGDKVRAI